ncbi:MFS transporter [Rhodococcus sp. ACT016]|uniref:MFS transporter n=1 Tax=Rhodococcus sp. ACT016 TaxID=3134808 RepID=UPI003D28633C
MAFAILGTVQATLIFTISLVSVPLPAIGREFALTSSQLVLIQASYGLPFSGLLLFGGRLTDRFGGRRLLVIGLSIFALASGVAGFASGFAMLITVRFVQGIGAAMIAPAALAALRAVYPDPARFGRAMATWGGVSVLGSTMGTLVSGALTNWMSWRWMFAVPVLVSAIALAAAHRMPTLPVENSRTRIGLDPVGAILATTGISVGSFGLIVTGEYGWSSPIVLSCLTIGAGALVAFFAVERRVDSPLLPPGFVRDRSRLVGLVGVLLAAAGTAVVTLLLSLCLQQVRGWSPLATTGAFVPYAVALIVAGQVAAQLVPRLGALMVTIVGLALGAAGLTLLAGIGPDTTFALGILPGLVLLPFGSAFAFSGAAVLATRNIPPHRAGLAGGVMNTSMELGPTVGLALFMAIAAARTDLVDGYAWAFGAAATAFAAAAIAAGAATRTLHRHNPVHTTHTEV